MSRGKECSSCRAYMKTAVKWKNQKEKKPKHNRKPHSPFDRNVYFHYLSPEIFLKFQTSNSDALFPLSGLSAQQLYDLEWPFQTFPCLHPLHRQTHTKLFLLIKQLHCWGDFHQWKLHLCLTCSTTSAEEWVCQNELYMEGLWTKALSN